MDAQSNLRAWTEGHKRVSTEESILSLRNACFTPMVDARRVSAMRPVPHPIPYQGSKRALAGTIIGFFPKNINRLVEPFMGSAAVSLAAAHTSKAKNLWLNDANSALMQLWAAIVEKPDELIAGYSRLWHEQLGDEQRFYNLVRERFNNEHHPEDFLYLLARCVKASVRYNPRGEFNQSPDNRRKGAHPGEMRERVMGASKLLRTCQLRMTNDDYRKVLSDLEQGDLVYFDPPYQGVATGRDKRYAGGDFSHAEFWNALERLDREKIPYILSYDGRCGNDEYGRGLPSHLGAFRIEVNVGRSTQATLLGEAKDTVESIYLSRSLIPMLPTGIRGFV